MAIQAGIVARNGHAIVPTLESLFYNRVHASSVDKLQVARGPGYLVVHGARSWAGEEQSWREDPSINPNYNVFFDGRLDNRDELIHRYFARQEQHQAHSDATIVGRVVTVGGVNALLGILGDWSAALLKIAARTLTLMSDGLGVRPLYYINLPTGVIWSSDLDLVVTAAGLGSSALDPAYFAGYIAGLPPPLTVPFKGVSAVRPGASLTIDDSGNATEHIWWAPWHVNVRSTGSEDTALELLTLWRRVIRDRLSPHTPMLFELSGGFDSSSIVSTAAHLLDNQSPGDMIHTVTRVFPNAPGRNDSRFVRAVLARCPCRSHYLDLSRLSAGRDFTTSVPDGPHAIDLANDALMRIIGARTLVSGRYGDLVMQAPTLDSSTVTASLQARGLTQSLSDATAVARAVRQSAWRVLLDAYQPFRRSYAGHSLLQAVYRRRRHVPVAADIVKRPLADDVDAKWAEVHAGCRSAALPRQQFAFALARLTHTRRLEPRPSQAHLFHTHPFVDRRIVCFVMEREPRVISSAGQSRGLMKTAFQNVLPAEILARRSKGNYAPLLRQQFLPTVHELLRMERFALAEIGVVEPQRVRDALRQCLEPTTVTPGAVMSFAFAEFWLRRVLFDEQDCSFGIDRATADDFTAEALLSGKQIFCDGTE